MLNPRRASAQLLNTHYVQGGDYLQGRYDKHANLLLGAASVNAAPPRNSAEFQPSYTGIEIVHILLRRYGRAVRPRPARRTIPVAPDSGPGRGAAPPVPGRSTVHWPARTRSPPAVRYARVGLEGECPAPWLRGRLGSGTAWH